MVEGFATVILRVTDVLRRNAVRDEPAVPLLEYLSGRIEGEELAYCMRLSPACLTPAASYTSNAFLLTLYAA